MMQAFDEEFGLLFERLLRLRWCCHVVSHCGGSEEPCHRARGVFAFRGAFFTCSWRNSIIASCVSKGPCRRPFLISSRPLPTSASTARRCSGVYSSSADGSFGRILMTSPETLNSSLSPVLKPARRRMLRGTISSLLLLTVMVMKIQD